MGYVASEIPMRMAVPGIIAVTGRAQEQVQVLALKHRTIVPGRIVSNFKLYSKESHYSQKKLICVSVIHPVSQA